MQAEDTALLFAGLITAILNILPGISALVPPQYSMVILAAGAILKAVVGNLPAQTQAGVYQYTALNSTGGTVTGSYSVTSTFADAEAKLGALGITQVKWGPQIA